MIIRNTKSRLFRTSINHFCHHLHFWIQQNCKDEIRKISKIPTIINISVVIIRITTITQILTMTMIIDISRMSALSCDIPYWDFLRLRESSSSYAVHGITSLITVFTFTSKLLNCDLHRLRVQITDFFNIEIIWNWMILDVTRFLVINRLMTFKRFVLLIRFAGTLELLRFFNMTSLRRIQRYQYYFDFNEI